MNWLIELLTIASVLRVIVAGELSKIDDDQTCMKFCSTYGNIGNFKDGNCACENLDNTDAVNAMRGNRETEYVDSTLDSNQINNEDRTIRSALKSRKHMRHHDADRVVAYFVNGGPANGHAYFVQATNQNMNPEKECKSNKYPLVNSYLDESNNQAPNEQPSSMINNQLKRSYTDEFINIPYYQYNPIYSLPQEMPLASFVINPYEHVAINPYNTVIEPKSNMLSYRAFPRNNFVSARLSPRTRPRTNILKRVSNALNGVIREPASENLVGNFLNDLIYEEPAAYSFNYNNKNTVDGNNIENENEKDNFIVRSTNEDEKTSTTNSKTASQGDIQRMNTSPTNFQNIPYNQQYLKPIYPLQYPMGSSTNGFYNTMPKAYILQPINIIPQGMYSMPQSEVINPLQSQESVNNENNNSTNTSDSINTSNCQIKTPNSNGANIENTNYSSITK